MLGFHKQIGVFHYESCSIRAITQYGVDAVSQNLRRSFTPVITRRRYLSMGITISILRDIGKGMLARIVAAERPLATICLAVLLMLNLQQSHVFCAMTGCTSQADSHDSVRLETVKPCCNKCCHAGVQADQSEPIPPDVSGSKVPCGNDCWCCQPPNPTEPPRTASHDGGLETFSHNLVPATFATVGQYEVAAGYVAHETWVVPGQICATLCRFVI